MKFVRKEDGKTYDNIMDAVHDYKCPGPCGDCILTSTVKLPNGDYGHMCHPNYATKYPASVATLMGLQVIQENTANILANANDDRYIAVIKSSAVRDVEIATKADASPFDEQAWYPMESAQVYLGIFTGTTALADAASFAMTDPANIELIKI